MSQASKHNPPPLPADVLRVFNPVRETQGGRIRPGQPLYQFVEARRLLCVGVLDPALPLVRWMMEDE